MNPCPTPEEIVERIRARREGDLLGFEWLEYLPYLTFDLAKEFLKPTTTEADWDTPKPLTREGMLEQIESYMEFAWRKANDFRGISASRSICHYIAWAWLAGDASFSTEIESAPYEFYGKDILVSICKFYGLDPERWDDGVRQNEPL